MPSFLENRFARCTYEINLIVLLRLMKSCRPFRLNGDSYLLFFTIVRNMTCDDNASDPDNVLKVSPFRKVHLLRSG